MARRQRLSETEIAELFDPSIEPRDLVRHFTLSAADLAVNRRCPSDHNRLRQALMLCYLRHPDRALRQGERPPAALLAFVAEQIGVLPEAMDAYLAAERNRQRHAVDYPEHLGLRPLGRLVTAADCRGARDQTPHPESQAAGGGSFKLCPQRKRGVWSRSLWSLVARLAVIPWSLVAQTRLKNPSNSLRD